MPETRSLLQLSVLQDQWLILALLIALAAVLVFFLAYLTAWRREEEGPGAPGAPAPRRAGVPWVLVVLYAVMAVYMILYVGMRALSPPNW